MADHFLAFPATFLAESGLCSVAPYRRNIGIIGPKPVTYMCFTLLIFVSIMPNAVVVWRWVHIECAGTHGRTPSPEGWINIFTDSAVISVISVCQQNCHASFSELCIGHAVCSS